MNSFLIILLQNMNLGKGTFGRPYDSTQGFSARPIDTFINNNCIWTLYWIQSLEKFKK